MIGMPNPWVILGVVLFFLASISGASLLAYSRGKDDMKAAYTTQELAGANKKIAAMEAEGREADKAGGQHDGKKTEVRNETRIIERTVTITPDSDPYMPVWFVRLFDRAAGRNIGSDPYPGKSDGERSDVRLSEVKSVLVRNFEACELNRVQLDDFSAYMREANERRMTVTK